MEETLKQLQEYQLEALRKGISFNLDVYHLNEDSTELSVKLSYVEADITSTDTRTYCTTFSNDVEDVTGNMRMGRIKKFINDIEKQ